MEHLQELLYRAAKQKEVELKLPVLQSRSKELKETVSELKSERDWAKLTAKNLEEPGFFQRLLGKVAQKQEKAQAEVRQAAATYEEAKRELDEVNQHLDALQEAYASLSGSRENYDLARTAFLATADADAIDKLCLMEIDAFRPVAIETVRQIRNALYAARGWMQREVQPRHSNTETRRMEFLQLADDYSEKLQELLVYFPEGSIALGASMTAPSNYIRSVSMNLSQIDYLNITIEQSLRVQEQIEAL